VITARSSSSGASVSVILVSAIGQGVLYLSQGGTTHATLQRARLSVRGLTANQCDSDMPHRRIGLGAMPMAFTCLDVYDITHIDVTLFMLRCHHAGARRHNQHLVAGMRVPSRSAALAEVHHAAVIVRGVAGLNDRLT
jgi:hypothetical protein